MRLLTGLGAVVWLMAVIGIVGTLRASKGAGWMTYVPPVEGRLLYGRYTNSSEIWEFDLASRKMTHLFTMPNARNIFYGHGGGDVYFIQSVSDESERIGRMDLNTCEDQTLLETDGSLGFQVSLSPDGSRLAYSVTQSSSQIPGTHTLSLQTGETEQVEQTHNEFYWSSSSDLVTLPAKDQVPIDDRIYTIIPPTDVQSLSPVGNIQPGVDITSVTVSPNEQWVAFTQHISYGRGVIDETLYVTHMESSETVGLHYGANRFSWDENNVLTYFDVDVGMTKYDPALREEEHLYVCLNRWDDTHGVVFNYQARPPGFVGCYFSGPPMAHEVITIAHPCAQSEAN